MRNIKQKISRTTAYTTTQVLSEQTQAQKIASHLRILERPLAPSCIRNNAKRIFFARGEAKKSTRPKRAFA